jgi:hypothetical protein
MNSPAAKETLAPRNSHGYLDAHDDHQFSRRRAAFSHLLAMQLTTTRLGSLGQAVVSEARSCDYVVLNAPMFAPDGLFCFILI